jgi:hypothetical protein
MYVPESQRRAIVRDYEFGYREWAIAKQYGEELTRRVLSEHRAEKRRAANRRSGRKRRELQRLRKPA